VYVPLKEARDGTDWARVLRVTAALASVLASTVAIIVALQS
jgi:hypothetical protein